VKSREAFFHLHMVSDATGETLIAVARAAAAQYEVRAIEHVHSMVRTARQLDKVFASLEEEPGLVLYTLVDRDLSERLEEACRRIGIPCASVLEPVLQLLQNYLGAPGSRRSGAQHVLDADYFRRIDALNFTMIHDDGQLAGSLEEADVVLVGISRTSKTPTSIYLANRGVKAANVPIVQGIPLPAGLEDLKHPLVVGLTATPERIAHLRENRVLSLNAAAHGESYVDKASIAGEVAFARKLCARHSWPVIDVTRRSIEETAAGIIGLLQTRVRDAAEAP
jgi:[pyruvate, water dikinase]-phosphate phosphotransferase / [pyruvate, water dikinase] kinase